MSNSKTRISHVTIQRLEGLALALLAVTILDATRFSLWLLPLSFLLFDISALGYIKNTKIGAITYNSVHNYALPIGILLSAQFINVNVGGIALVLGSCWLFHVAADRALGYGLKYTDSFMHTHLGNISAKQFKK